MSACPSLRGISSVALYCLAMFMPFSFWWLIGLFLVPLLYSALNHKLTWLDGFVWGLFLALCIGGVEVYCALGPLTLNPLLKIGMGIAFILYIALHSLLFFGLGQLITVRLRITHPLTKSLLWSLIFWIFFIWLSSYLLWIFGRCEGASYFTNPITALLPQPQLLQPITILGKYGLLLILIFWQALLTLCYARPRIPYALAWFTLTTLWLLMGNQLLIKTAKPDWFNRIAYIPRSIPQTFSVSHAATVLRTYLEVVGTHDPTIDIFIIPEDGFQSCQLATIKELCAQCMPSFDSPKHLIIGAYRKENNKEYNTLYRLMDGVLKDYYDKQHTMIVTEEIPALCGTSILQQVIKTNSLARGQTTKPILKLFPDLHVVPYICSELLLLDKPGDEHHDLPILALCSDKWAPFTIYKQRALHTAQLKALEWQRDIVFISYSTAGLITKNSSYVPFDDNTTLLQQADERVTELQKNYTQLCNLDYDTHTSIDNYKAPDKGFMVRLCSPCTGLFRLGLIQKTKSFSLLLVPTRTYTGFSFWIISPISCTKERITLVVKQVPQQDAFTYLYFYIKTDSDAIYFVDHMRVPPTTTHLVVTVNQYGAITIEDSITQQTRVMSKYR